MTAAWHDSGVTPIADRLAALDWSAMERSLWEHGYAKTPPLLTPDECAQLIALYPDDARFRSRIDMRRYRFGVGEYKYFAAPLPRVVEELRVNAYPPLAAIANQWEVALDTAVLHPTDLRGLLARCHKKGQTKPTPLLLHYETGGYNCLHQDLYGDVYFPFQILTILSEPGVDFEGGEFVLMEQRPRAQSRAHVLTPPRGAFVIFPTRERPNRGKGGYHRVGMRHGVATVTRGRRTAMGVIFHDSR